MILPIKLLLWILTPLIVLAGVVLLVNTTLSVDDLRSCPEPQPTGQCQVADAIVAISGGDTDARTREAINLYQQGWAPSLVLSGAAQDKTGISNAAAMSRQALAAGVPESAIILDEYAADTAGNAAGLRAIAERRDFKRIILVTSPYHQRRASIEFAKALGPTVIIVSHPTPYDKYWSPYYWWLNPYSWFLSISELTKLVYVNVSK